MKGLDNIKKSVLKILRASILTGALLFNYSGLYAQRLHAKLDSIRRADTTLLVKNDSIEQKAEPIDTNFTKLDTVKSETVMNDTIQKKKKIRSPQKAGLYSAIIPGMGQVYNRKYWKVPLIYAGGAVLVYYSILYNNMYKDYLDRYNTEYFKPADQQDDWWMDRLASARDGSRKYRDRFILWTGILYAANIVDAIVDAYFVDFDISDDLSMKVHPSINYPEFAMGPPSLGMALRFNF